MKEYNLLTEGLDFLNLSYTDEMINKFMHYLLLYKEWNQKMNISSILEDERIIIRHFLDSLAPLHFLKNYDFWNSSLKSIDLGSGGGFPGIPLKIIEPERLLDFAEVNKKKICFLKEVILNLPLSNVNIIDSSSGKVKKNYQILLVRAFGSLKKIINETQKYIQKGKIIAYKGRKTRIKKEIEELSPKQKNKLILEKVKTPFLDEERYIVILEI